MEAQTPAAPTPPADVTAPVTVSASVDAASRDDYAAFNDAEIAAKKGTPLPAVERKSEPATPAPQSKRQQAINDSIREAVDRATSETRAEIERLRSQLSAQPKPAHAPEPVTPPAQKDPEYKRYVAMPDAPKLEDFESLQEHAAAMSLFVFNKASQEARSTAQQEQFQDQRNRFLAETSTKYGERLIAAREADPDFLSKIPPALVEAIPLSGLADGAPSTFANVAAEAALYSEDPATFYKYLHANRGEVDRIAQLPKDQWLSTLRWLDGRVSGAPVTGTVETEAPATPVATPSTITDAPPPPQQIRKTGNTTDPMLSALKHDDYAAFNRIEMDRLTAKKRSA